MDLKKIAKITEGFSGADLDALCREAGMHALRENKKTKEVKMEHFENALKEIGPSLNKRIIEFYEKFSERTKRKIVEEAKQEERVKYVG